MEAALDASDETVSLLLSLGANPDKTDEDGKIWPSRVVGKMRIQGLKLTNPMALETS